LSSLVSIQSEKCPANWSSDFTQENEKSTEIALNSLGIIVDDSQHYIIASKQCKLLMRLQ